MKAYIEQKSYITREKIGDYLYNFVCDNKPTCLILITRKGYWLYKILDTIETENIKIISDRYELKDFEFEQIKDKVVAFFDDSITNGNNMFFYYSLFRKHGAKKVIPFVYAVSTEYLKKCNGQMESKLREYKRAIRNEIINKTEKEIELESKEMYEEFQKDLKYQVIMTPDDIARLCIQEMIWFQEELSPMVMDLPIFSYMKNISVESNVTDKKSDIRFNEQQFKKITTNTDNWCFVENCYDQTEKTIQSCFFQYQDEVLYEKFQDMFFNFVVKCKYEKDKEGNIQAVFVPFAIVRSFDFESTWRCFSILFDKTKYYDYVMNYVNNKMQEYGWNDIVSVFEKNHNFARAIFRAVIYSLSIYIGYLFKEKIFNDVGIELELNWDIMLENNILEFQETIKKQWDEFEHGEYESKMFKCPANQKITPINIQLNLNKERVLHKATKENVELYIRFRVLNTRYLETSARYRLVTIETLELELSQRYQFRSSAQKRRYITEAILLLLDISCMGNEIIVENNSEAIYRGFRAGENSEILLGNGIEFVYPYAYATYYYVGKLEDTIENQYKTNIKKVMKMLNAFFYEKGYIGEFISEEAFLMFCDYFINLKKPHELICNKSYLLDSLKTDKIKEGERLYIKECFRRVEDWLR